MWNQTVVWNTFQIWQGNIKTIEYSHIGLPFEGKRENKITGLVCNRMPLKKVLLGVPEWIMWEEKRMSGKIWKTPAGFYLKQFWFLSRILEFIKFRIYNIFIKKNTWKTLVKKGTFLRFLFLKQLKFIY